MLSLAPRSLRPSLSRSFVSRLIVSKTFALTVASTLAFAGSLNAQAVSSSAAAFRAPADRLTQPIVESNRVVLGGTVHPLANKANDRGAVSDGMKLDRIQVVLKRSDAQESALKQLIGDMHTPGSANYHKWLTPEDFGKQFGPSDADIAKLQSWLGSHGFGITKLNPGRQTLEIAGTAGQFRDTFHTQIHSYQVKGETHFANASVPEIPAAVAPVFGGFASLNNFHLKSQAHVLGKAQYEPATHKSTPEWTYGTKNGFNLLLAPADFAAQYDLNPLYKSGTKGDGQSIAIVNESNINIAQVNNYRALFGLPVNPPQVIIDGNDPGVDGINSPYGPNGASFEAYLDVEVSGAVAPNALINLVIADSTALEDGLALAAQRAVYSNISPILSLSFGNCEAALQSGNSFWSNLWEQAAAQGITVTVSSGDSGSAACDNDNTQQFAVHGQAVNGIASTPYNVAVGGTDFYYSGGSTTIGNYWNLSSPNTNTPTESLGTATNSKIPEQPFNNSQFAANLNPASSSSGTSIFAAGGGASTAGLASGNTYVPYPKPSWQAGSGVPSDNARDLPDVSLFGALNTNYSYTPICAQDGDCEGGQVVQISGVGGTSVSAPEFAGIMALVNQKYGRQGQANYVLYPLAKQFPSSFNDVSAGTNTVACNLQTVFDSSNNNAAIAPKDCQTATPAYTITDNEYGASTEGEIGLSANQAAYNAGVGYDLASGLGSVDGNNLLTNWANVKFAATSTTLTYSAATSAIAVGESVSISGKVSATAGGTVPTGTVALLASSTEPNAQGQPVFALDSTGAFAGTVNSLPGGTYNLTAYYSGDGANAPSTSAASSITIGAVASTPNFKVYVPTPSGYAATASGSTVPYGTIALSATPGDATGKTTTAPTGTVQFLNGTAVLGTSVVNVEGDAEYNPVLPPSSSAYSLTASYSGDASYNPSTSTPVTVTVTKDKPVINIINTDQNVISASGSIFTVLIENSVNFTGVPILAPTGTLTLTGAPSGTTASATLTAGVDPSTGSPAGVAIFTVPAKAATGNYTFAFSYSGDSNYSTQNFSAPETLYVYNPGGVASTTTASVAASTTSPISPVLVTATVSGSSGTPTGTVYLVVAGSLVGEGNLPTGSGSSVVTTIPVTSGGLLLNTNQITVQYEGDNTYYPSATTVTITNPLSDFSLVPQTTILGIPNSGSNPGVQTDTINLISYNGFAGAVALTCSAPTGITCALGTASATLASGGTASTTLSVNTSGITTAGTYSVVVTGTDSTGHFIHTIGLQVVTSVITAPSSGSFSLSNSGAITIASAGGTGTSTISITPGATPYAGAVNLTCSVALASGSGGLPTCSLSSASVTLSGAVATSTLTVNASSTAKLDLPLKGLLTAGGGLALATLFFFGVPVGRRGKRAVRAIRALRILSAALFFALIAGAGMGCGSGSGNGGGGTGPTSSTYTVTVTGTPTSGTAQATTVSVTVN